MQDTITAVIIPQFLLSAESAAHLQGCQMVYFQTKNPNLGKF
jgi:hypothetical protein